MGMLACTQAVVDTNNITRMNWDFGTWPGKPLMNMHCWYQQRIPKPPAWTKARLCLTMWLLTSHCRPELRFLADTKELFVQYLALRMSFKGDWFWACCYASYLSWRKSQDWLVVVFAQPLLIYTAAEKFRQGSYVFSHTLSLQVKFCLEHWKVKKTASIELSWPSEISHEVGFYHCASILLVRFSDSVAGAYSLERKRKLFLSLVIAYKKKGWSRSKLRDVKKNNNKYRRVVGLVTGHAGVTV